MTDLIQAIAELRRVTPPNSPWEAGDIGVGSSPVDYHIATILNAAASGDLLPVQCCMCGKTDLSIKEDGGPECELQDGRWVCSGPCWDKASLLEGGDLIPRSEADMAVAMMVEPLLKLREGIEADIRSAHHGRGNGSSSAMREDDRDFRAAVAAAFDALAPDAGTAALAELQVLRDERDAAVANQFITRVERDGAEDHATETADELRQVRARAEAAEAELARVRARGERLVEALEDIAKQKRTDELDTEHDVEMADFEGGYDAAINVARAALAQTPTDPGDGWTWNERLGWIGPDGKPAYPRRRG